MSVSVFSMIFKLFIFMHVFSPWQSLSKLTWLGENVQFVAVSFIGTGIKRKPESKALWPDFLTFRFFYSMPRCMGTFTSLTRQRE